MGCAGHFLPAFFPDRFLSSMSKSSNSPWLLPQTANHYVPLHDTRVLDGLYLHTWHHQIKSWLLYSTYFAIVVGYALMSYVKACVLLVSQQFAKRLPTIFNMTLACCILLPLMVYILLCGWCWIPENATGTKWSDNMPCLHKPSHFQLSVMSHKPCRGFKSKPRHRFVICPVQTKDEDVIVKP